MENQINELIEAIKADYTRTGGDYERFADGLSFKVGKKYIKIISNHSAWGFIVKGDDDAMFKKGDILMAASWATPARNHPRGNIIEGGYRVQWTGPVYMSRKAAA